MKTMTKKLGSVVLALCLCLSLCCTALAASGNGGSITINNAAKGETYTIYQIFDLTYSDDKSSYSYQVTEDWADFFAEGAAGAAYVTLDSNGYVTANKIAGNEQAFAKAALAYAKDAEITGSSKEATSDTVTFEGLPLGYYLVDTTLGSLCALTTTEPNAEIKEKNPTPTVTKEIREDDYSRKDEDIEHDDGNGHFEENVDGDGWGTWDDADNNQTIVYHLTLTDINGALNLTVHDYLETGLDFTKIESIVLYKDSSDEEGTTLVAGTDYILTQGKCSDPDCKMDNCTFEIHFVSETGEYTGLTRLFDDLTSDAYLVITYDALTDTHSGDYTDYEDDILNHAYLTYGTASYTTPTTTETELFGFGVYKYTEDEDEEKTALANAEFTLSKETDSGIVYATFTTETNTTDGNTYYMITGWTSDSTTASCKLVSGTDGMIRIEGLDDDTYILTETAAPDGYNKLTDTITVIIAEDGTVTFGNTSSTAEKETAVGHVVDVENNAGQELPGTGGIGTTIFYIIGGVLVAGAVVVLITRRRMSHEA